MGRALSFTFLTALFLVGLPGCVEEFGRIHETDMPRIASDSERIGVAQATPSSIDRFNARALWEEYGSNSHQADLESKGKFLQVTGVVQCVVSDDKGRPYVDLQVFDPVQLPANRLKALSGKEKAWYQDGFPPLVLCYLEPGERSRLALVKKAQTLQLTGRCLGRVKDPSGFKDYLVVLDSCRIGEE